MRFPISKTQVMRPVVFPLLPLLVAFALQSCVSPKFERAWKGASLQTSSGGTGAPDAAVVPRARGQAAKESSLPTRWEGRWHSDKHNAGGRLRAVVQPPVAGRAEIFFEAGWHGFTTAYPVSLVAERKGKSWQLSGEHNLRSCVGGGVYHYTGTIRADQFSANYQSKYDTGTFLLSPSPAQ